VAFGGAERLIGPVGDTAYRPTYPFDGEFLNAAHAGIHAAVADVPGWLRPEDALKLYELAYYADGPILEIGTYRGKSAVVIASAVRDAGKATRFLSIDVDRSALGAAAATLAERGLADRVTLVHGSSRALFRTIGGLQPALVFVDGDHTASGVAADLVALETRVPRGGLILLHDYVDDRNERPQETGYGVPQGVESSWVPRDCDFVGAFGCTALFRRREGGPAASSGPILVDALARDSLAVQLTQRVRRPLGRVARRVLGR
jgi:predicted O-methyltransferase YrrM